MDIITSHTIAAISGPSPIVITPSILEWGNATSNPKLNQADNASPTIIGQALTIQAQNATGTTSTGGDLILTSGTGTSINGNIDLQCGGVSKLQITPSGVALNTVTSAPFLFTDSSGNIVAGGATPIKSGDAAGGNLSGSYPNPTVSKINGTTISTAGGSLTTGKVLRVTGSSTVDYGAVDLANSNAVTGTLPTGNQAPQSLGGDLSGTTNSATVIKIQSRAVASTAPTNGQVLAWNNGASQWQPISPPSGATWANDLVSSTNTDQWVSGISGSSGNGGTITLGDSTHNLSLTQVTATTFTAPTLTILSSTGRTSTAGNAGGLFLIGAGNGGNGTTADGGYGAALHLQAGNGGMSSSGGIGGNGGDIILTPGTGGSGTSSGVPGKISLSGSLVWTNDTISPTITQADRSGSPGADLIIQAQSTGLYDGPGGNVNLVGGLGGNASGGQGTGKITFSFTDGATINNYLSAYRDDINNSGVIAFASYLHSATIKQDGDGNYPMIIQAQSDTTSSSTGGNIVLSVGTGTSSNGKINLNNVITTTTAPSAGSSTTVTPAGYIDILVNGNPQKIAYYNNS